MEENLFIAVIIYLHLVIYAIIYLNADLTIQTNTLYHRVTLAGFISIISNYEFGGFFSRLVLLNE